MRIRPVNYNSYNSFGAVRSTNKNIAQEILGDKQGIYDAISNEKGVDIWTFKSTKGGMMNQQVGYIVLIQDQKNGNVLKEIAYSAENKDELNKKVEDSLMWYKASDNYRIASNIKETQIVGQSPRDVEETSYKLMRIAMSNEANAWECHFNMI